MSKRMIAAVAATGRAAAMAVTQAASAQEVKVGVILPYTGVGAELAQQIERGMELYLKLNADQVKPYTITLVKRDSKAPDGAAAKIAAQELLTRTRSTCWPAGSIRLTPSLPRRSSMPARSSR